MNEEFKIGDVVQLKSGGVLMTVGEIKDKNVSCVWFAGIESSSLQYATLPNNILTKITKEA